MKAISIINMPDYKKLGNLMHDTADLGCVICCVLSYEQAFDLFRELSIYDDIQLGSIHLQNEDYNGYDREYYVTLDSDMVLDIAPAWHKGDETHSDSYAYNEADTYLFDSDAHASVMAQYQDKECYELRFVDSGEETVENSGCGDCCNDCCSCVRNNEALQYLHNIKTILDEIFK